MKRFYYLLIALTAGLLSPASAKETISTKLTGYEWAGAGMLLAKKQCYLERGWDPQVIEDWYEEQAKETLGLKTKTISSDKAVQILSKAYLPIHNEKCNFSLKDLKKADASLYKKYVIYFSDGIWAPAHVKSE
jgi:hypothetical protein